MKIAVSTDSGLVSPHFGRCESYTIAEVEGNQVLSTREIANPGHHPGFLPQFLFEKGISCIICGGMGRKAQSLFQQWGIGTILGVTGPVEEAIQRFSAGTIERGESLCKRGNEKGHRDGECGHPHGHGQ